MANYVLTTSPQEVGKNISVTVGCRLLAWYVNYTPTSVIVHLKLQAISQGINYTGTNKDYELNIDTTQTGTVSWPYAPLRADEWVDVNEITRVVNYDTPTSVSGKVWTYVYGDAWITGNTVSVAAPYTAPDTPTLTITDQTTDSVSVTYGTTSFGNPASGTVMLYGGNTTYPNTLWDTTNTIGNKSFTMSGLVANTTYYLRARAYNNQMYSIFVDDNVTTDPPQFTVENTDFGEETATFAYSKQADGGALAETLYYSLDNGSNWTSFATASAGEALNGTFTLSGLTPETSYTMITKLTTTAGDFDGPEVTFSTAEHYKIYGSVNGVTKRINKLYGPVPVNYLRISGVSNQTLFNPVQFSGKYYSTYGPIPLTTYPTTLNVSTSGSTTIVSIGYNDGTSKTIFTYPTNNYNYAGSAWGWTSNNFPPVSGTIATNAYVDHYETKSIDKLYGSVNGQTKRIF